MNYDISGRYIGWAVDLEGAFHELSSEETLEDAHARAWERWQKPFRCLGVTHENWIIETRREYEQAAL